MLLEQESAVIYIYIYIFFFFCSMYSKEMELINKIIECFEHRDTTTYLVSFSLLPPPLMV